MALIRNDHDGVIRTRQWWEGEATLITEKYQPSKDAILNDNAEIRKNPGALRTLDSMQWALQIPTVDYDKLIKCNPLLSHPDADIRNKAWKTFISSDESLPYRVREQSGRIIK